MTTKPEQWGRECAYCHNDFEPSAKGQRAQYCSPKCRQRAYNARRRQARREQVEAQPVDDGQPAVEAHVISAVLTSHLAGLDAADTVEGRAALTLAKRIDMYGENESGSGLAALVRELRSSLAVVSPNAGAIPHGDHSGEDPDDIDDLKRRRDARRAQS